jgi:N-acyl-D-aspartate/D-glutamate deacylase
LVDLIVFAPERFAERGTLARPNQLATGIDHVIVKGVVTWEDGELTVQRGGQVIRRR